MHCLCGVCQYRGRSGVELIARPFSSFRPLRPGNESGPMRMSVKLMRVAVGVQSYHAHWCRILVRVFAVELLNSALADLPSHVACHVGM